MINFPTVWIVDADDQFILAEAFKQVTAPVVIKQFNDGDELLPSLEQSVVLPKLILLDLNMVRQNGFETLSELRSLPAYEHLPVVILTTSDWEEDKLDLLHLTGDGF